MSPPARFTYHYHPTTGRWSVVDRLLGRAIRTETSALVAADVARDQEAAWRRACERWRREEHGMGDGPPPSIF